MSDGRAAVLVERSLWVLLVVAPWILHLGTGDFAPTWGAPETPAWAIAGVFVAAAAGVVLGWRGIHRGAPQAGRTRYAVMVTFSVVVLTPIALFALFQLVHIFAVVLALPYAIALVGVWTGWGKRGNATM